MAHLLKKHQSKVRFLIVGGVNTAIDFTLLFLFTALGMQKIAANTLSTGVAFIFSFFANRQYTFKDTSNRTIRRQFVAFTLVTLAGLWVLQPLIILAIAPFFEANIPNEQLALFVIKVIATAASMVWNYILYSRFVFKK